jgi:exosortase
VIPFLVVAGGVAIAYREVAVKLVRDWATNDNYSHGFLIVPLALYFAWERRNRLLAATARPTSVGLLVLLLGISALGVGTLGAELFVTRVSLLIVIAGILLFLGGWHFLRILSFPLAFLLLMIPIPTIVFNQVAFPLQLLASRFGENILWTAGIPVLREGNIITLANASLEVAEACSGIRSLVSLLTLTIAYSHFSEPRRVIRILLALSTVPIAIVMNGIRVASIGIIAARFGGPDVAEGTFHTVSGWMVFVTAFAAVLVIHRLSLAAVRWARKAPSAQLPPVPAMTAE